MSSRNFQEVMKEFLKSLPRKDYPVLNTFTFVSCWLSYAMDKSITRMRDLFARLNYQGIDIAILNEL